LPEGLSLNIVYNEVKHYYRVKIKGKNNDGKTMKSILDDLGLLGTKSDTKFIPKDYLYSDYESRVKLLQGLIDTDGHVNKIGLMEYNTASLSLANDIIELMRSLGKAARLRKYQTTDSDTPIYRVVEMKVFKNGLSILDIVPTGEFTEMQCIKVSNEDHLYFTNDYTLTHNTTTATVLAQAIIKEGLKYVAAGGSPLGLKRGIDKALNTALSLIDEKSQEITDRTQIEFVAAISGNEPEVGLVVADAIEAVGTDGIITLEESKERETYFKMVDGFTYNQGYVSPYLISDTSRNITDYKEVSFILFDGEVPAFEILIPILEKVGQKTKGKPLMIIAETFSAEAIQTLYMNKIRGGHRSEGVV
jgi:hypothetical protein